jgi:hypothetical protein
LPGKRHERVVERPLRVARQRGRLRDGVVAGKREHAAVLAHPGVVGVLEHVAGPVHTGRLAVPHAQYAVVLRPREGVDHLAAEHRGGAEVLVEAGGEDDVMLGEKRAVALERLVEAAQRRPAIAGDEGGGAQAAPPVRPVLVEGETHERLDAGEEDEAFLLRVLGIQRELVGL